MAYEQLVWRAHVVERMFTRRIDAADVKRVLREGEIIRRYGDDKPYPSYLVLGYRGEDPLHVVAADDDDGKRTIVITVYEPDPAEWDAEFRTRKKP